MHIHRFEKLWIGLAFVMILALISTVAYGAVGPGIEMVDDDGGTIDPGAVANGTSGTGFDDPGIRKVGTDEYEVYVTAQRFAFIPGNITVPADSTVTFYVTSPDVIHGFSVVGTNVNAMVIPGQIAELEVEFDDPDVYGIVCNEYCGAAHHSMEGRLNVVPQSQFDMNETEGSA